MTRKFYFRVGNMNEELTNKNSKFYFNASLHAVSLGRRDCLSRNCTSTGIEKVLG